MEPITSQPFGQLADGRGVDLYTLTNPSGAYVTIMTYGGILTQVLVPDRAGRLGDVVLGFETLEPYAKGHPFFGALCGRVANRIGGASFELDGTTYKVAATDGENSLHGGRKGFDKRLWTAEPRVTERGPALRLTYRSVDGEEGYPGNLDVTVTYLWTDGNALHLDYEAVTDAPTILNLTNHSYFNLAGGGPVYDHEMLLFAERYTVPSAKLVPTGEIAPVAGTPLDFTVPRRIGERLGEMTNKPQGYDHNYVLTGADGMIAPCARVSEPTTGRVMEVETTEPGVQFYSGNFLDGKITGKRGVVYGQHHGFCLETQHFPDSIHHPHFPSTVLRPGEIYRQTTIYRFGVASA